MIQIWLSLSNQIVFCLLKLNSNSLWFCHPVVSITLVHIKLLFKLLNMLYQVFNRWNQAEFMIRCISRLWFLVLVRRDWLWLLLDKLWNDLYYSFIFVQLGLQFLNEVRLSTYSEAQLLLNCLFSKDLLIFLRFDELDLWLNRVKRSAR